MRLRSGNLRKSDGDGGSRMAGIPDLNLNDEADGGSSEEGGYNCCEVSNNEGKSNGLLCEGMEVENKGNVEGLVGNGGGVLRACSTRNDQQAGFVQKDADVGGERKENGVEELACAVGLAGQGLASSAAAVEGVNVGRSEEEEAGEKSVECSSGMRDKALCPGEVEGSGTDKDKEHVVSVDVSGCVGVDSNYKAEREKEQNECDPDKSRHSESDCAAPIESLEKRSGVEGSQCKFFEGSESESLTKEVKEGGVQVFGKVLRSRIVPANGLGEAGGGEMISPKKRKRETDGAGEVGVTMKDVSSKSAVDAKRSCTVGRPKRSTDHSEGELVELNKVPFVSITEDDVANDKSCRSSERKGKRGRPKRSLDHPEKKAVQVVSKVKDEDMDDTSILSPKKDRAPVVSNTEDEDANHMSVRGPERKGKRGRPSLSLEYPEEKAVQVASGHEDEDLNDKVMSSRKDRHGRPRTSLVCRKEEDEVACKDKNEAGNVSNKSVGSSTQRRRSERPKRAVDYCEQEAAKRKKVSVCKVDDEGPSNISVTSSKDKGKRGRPKKEGVTSDNKITSRGPETRVTHTSLKGEEAENNLSVKGTKVETAVSSAAEKNAIRKQIVDMILTAGWTIEYRPRYGREYNDAVYVNADGKTHWSVTKAYNQLQREFELGKAPSFTPLPEDVLSKLFRVVSKIRSDKNKKKKPKGEDDFSDEEDEGGSTRSKAGAKHKHSAFKRKPAIRDGTQSKRRCALVVRRSKGLNSESDVAISHSGKHSILSWMIDSGTVKLDAKVHYMNRRKTAKRFEGSITKDGIHCYCCKKVLSVFEFEKHAGSKVCQPYEYLHVESGNSLLQCQLDSWNKQEEAGRSRYHIVNVDSEDPNDDTCAICGDGGDLMCCDGCPSTFHHDCLNIEEVPSGEWHCVYCSCKVCGGADEGASGDCDTASCSLVSCSVCEEKYHPSCIDEENDVVGSGEPTFCGRNCEQIFERLENLLGRKEDLGDGFSWTLLRRSDVKGEAVSFESQKIQNNSKLAVAMSVMDECFMPILDPRSGINLIRHVVYNCGSNFNRLNFSSFFTIILEKGDEVIAAASIRIHGKLLAEMPFIGTRNIYRRQGMCRRLLTAIELALGSLDVENLVIPAISELTDTWTAVFGFKPLEESVREEMNSMNMVVFAHTDMLQKPLSKNKFVEKGIVNSEKDENYSRSRSEHVDGGLDKSEVDDGCLNGAFDLNVVAAGIPESLSDRKHLGSTAGNCEDDVKSRMDSPRLNDTSEVEGQPTLKENEGNAMDSLMGKRLQPDLNMAEENDRGDSVTRGYHGSSSDKRCLLRPCFATFSSDEAAKSTANPRCTKVEGCSTLKNDADQNRDFTSVTSSSGERTLEPCLNLMLQKISEFDNGLPANSVIVSGGTNCQDLISRLGEEGKQVEYQKGDDSVPELTKCCKSQTSLGRESMRLSSPTGSQEADVERSKLTTSNNDHKIGNVAFGINSEEIPVGVISKFEIHEKNISSSSNGNVHFSNGSLVTGSQFPAKTIECPESDSLVVCTSVTHVTSESSCNMSSAAAESTGLFHGNGTRKVGLN